MSASSKKCRLPSCAVALGPSDGKLCAQCKQAVYCNRACQKKHWKEHKKERNACFKEGAKLAEESTLAPRDENGGRWVYRPEKPLSAEEQEELLALWAASMNPRNYIRGCNAEESMQKLNITASFVKGLEVGDWHALNMRMRDTMKTIKVKNNPPLKIGDRVEVLCGNNIKWETVGQKGRLREYFGDERKWGIEYDDGELGLVSRDNLKRVMR